MATFVARSAHGVYALKVVAPAARAKVLVAIGAGAIAVYALRRVYREALSTQRDRLLRFAVARLARARSDCPMPPATGDVQGLPEALPAVGIGDAAALGCLAPIALDGAAQLGHPGYFAHMDPQSAEVACAAAVWQVAMNQNMLHPDAAPSGRALEQRVVASTSASRGSGRVSSRAPAARAPRRAPRRAS